MPDKSAPSAAAADSARVARERNVKARAALVRAVEEEIFRRLHIEDSGPPGSSMQARLLAEEATIRSRARDAFTAAGGTPADFRRMWPTVFRAACGRAS